MLQREMDSSVDYGAPLIVAQKKGWLHNFLNRKETGEEIPVINSKVSDQDGFWSKLKYASQIETPIRIIGVVVLGTLLGAAYAVTIQGGNKQMTEKTIPLSTSSEEQKTDNGLSQDVAQKETLEVSPEVLADSLEEALIDEPIVNKDLEVKEELDLSTLDLFAPDSDLEATPKVANLSETEVVSAPENMQKVSHVELSTAEKSFTITAPKTFTSPPEKLDESVYSNIVIPEKFIPQEEETEEGGLSEAEQKIILELEKKLALTQEKIKKVDMKNLKLQGKFETLVVKNRALSDQLKHINTVTNKLKGQVE